MSPSVCVFGLWHLGCVTAACLAADGVDVVGLDLEPSTIDALLQGRAPIAEPGLDRLLADGLKAGCLRFTSDPAAALRSADVLWVAFDTPVTTDDRAEPDRVRQQLELARASVAQGTLVIVSSQVPVGFTHKLETDWQQSEPSLRFACLPENLRLGQAVARFRQPEWLVIGLGQETPRVRLQQLVGSAADRIVWMSLESAEMTKHAVNGFLAVSATYANELARICERVGADAHDVERGLRLDSRVGLNAYVAPGPPLAGGTLGRDVAFLRTLASENHVVSPILNAIAVSNQAHQEWTMDHIGSLVHGTPSPRVALLGLTYKAGTDTLRRSFALELIDRLAAEGMHVRAFDPVIHELPHIEQTAEPELAPTMAGVLDGADVAILTTPWPDFLALDADELVRRMRKAQVIDQTGFLSHLATDPRITYVQLGRDASRTAAGR